MCLLLLLNFCSELFGILVYDLPGLLVVLEELECLLIAAPFAFAQRRHPTLRIHEYSSDQFISLVLGVALEVPYGRLPRAFLLGINAIVIRVELFPRLGALHEAVLVEGHSEEDFFFLLQFLVRFLVFVGDAADARYPVELDLQLRRLRRCL